MDASQYREWCPKHAYNESDMADRSIATKRRMVTHTDGLNPSGIWNLAFYKFKMADGLH